MIFYDPSELRKGTALSDADVDRIKEIGRPCPKMEELTGADFLVSSMDERPSTMEIVREHLVSGALLVQRKSGQDLVTSIADNRIRHSLARMLTTGARMSQRICLATGVFLPMYSMEIGDDITLVGDVFTEAETTPRITWTATSLLWTRFLSAITKAGDRGMRFEFLPHDCDIVDWLEMKRRHLVQIADKPIYRFFPSADKTTDYPNDPDALQILQEITDIRYTLSTIPGIGEKRAEDAFRYAPTEYIVPMLSNPANVGKALPSGIGRKTIEQFRNHFNLPPDFCYDLVPIGTPWTHCSVHNIMHPGTDEHCPMCVQDDKISEIVQTHKDNAAGIGNLGDDEDLPWDKP